MQNAVENFAVLRNNSYPGRGIVVGRTPDGNNLFQMAWLMGRSDDSRNRRYVHEGKIVRTTEADPSRPLKNPELTLYTAMRVEDDIHMVSNGRQTDTVFEEREREYGGNAFMRAMTHWEYEPDPNATSRITAVFAFRHNPFTYFYVHSKSPFGVQCEGTLYKRHIPIGYGYCIHTYAGDGNPLPPYRGEPLLVPALNSITGLSDYYWGTLNVENKVALVTKFINIETGDCTVHIINRY